MKRKEQYQDFHDFIIEGTMLCLEKYTINELPLTEVCKKSRGESDDFLSALQK